MKPRSVKVFSQNFSPLYFKELARLDKFSKNCFLGPHLCWQRSPLGPHLTQNWVPILNKIGSPWHLYLIKKSPFLVWHSVEYYRMERTESELRVPIWSLFHNKLRPCLIYSTILPFCHLVLVSSCYLSVG